VSLLFTSQGMENKPSSFVKATPLPMEFIDAPWRGFLVKASITFPLRVSCACKMTAQNKKIITMEICFIA